ncbi:MAG TPA: hypothetical protein VLC95_12685 [Anaerolineae bacterium]|nr:hypothetical protein [Anaerolineae bacterium]
MILQSALVLLGNEVMRAVVLLFLLAASAGQALLLPSRWAWFGALAVAVAWVVARQAMGTWVRAEVVQSMFELAGLALNLLLAGAFRATWEEWQQERRELLDLRRVLVGGEAGTGLLPIEVAELRLVEEVDRARQFRRPLGLLIVHSEPERDPPPGTRLADVEDAVTRQLVSASLVHDVPFRIDAHRVGLLLPERDWKTLYADTEVIVAALRQAVFVDGSGHELPVAGYLRLGFGLGTYQGEAAGKIDLMRAANDSLSVGQDLADIGETGVTAYAMPAAVPIAGPGPRAVDEEE